MSPSALLRLEEKSEELVPLGVITDLVDAIYALDVTTFTDEDFAKLENIIDKAAQIVNTLPTSPRRLLTDRLLTAREGVEQGMAPDPNKRPSLDEIRAFVSAHLA